jgi:hypothetical protein
MKDVINKFYKNHSLLYKVLLFISTTFLIVYLFPKSGKFKYSFEKGKPWQSENLYAPFDFAIKKTDEEITLERENISENAQVYFDIDTDIVVNIRTAFDAQFTKEFPDSVAFKNKKEINNQAKSILSDLYAVGILDKDYDYPDDTNLILLNNRNQVGVAKYGSLIQLNEITTFIDNQIEASEFINYRSQFLSLFFDIIKPNVNLNKVITSNKE